MHPLTSRLGPASLQRVDCRLGLAFDASDVQYYYNLFANVLKRNPTDVECFDLAQSNSEHSRHWFFRGKQVIDGVAQPYSLMDMVKSTLRENDPNSLVAFCDNSSVIRGFRVPALLPLDSSKPSAFKLRPDKETHLLLTAETHNFPTGVAPFQGATTGTGKTALLPV